MSFTLGTNTIIKENILVKQVIALLDKQFTMSEWANREFEGEITQQGDTVSVQTFPRISFTTGTTAGADITATTFTITKETLVIDTLQQVLVTVTNLEEIQSNLALREKIGSQIMYSMRNVIDGYVSYVAITGALTGNKLHEGSAATADKTTIHALIEEMRVALASNNAFQQAALFVEPAIASLIRQSSLFDGFREGLDARIEGYVGKMSGFLIYETNNLAVAKKMLAMDKDSVHLAVQWTGYDERKEPKGFRTNILSEFVMGSKVFSENSKRIATLKYA